MPGNPARGYLLSYASRRDRSVLADKQNSSSPLVRLFLLLLRFSLLLYLVCNIAFVVFTGGRLRENDSSDSLRVYSCPVSRFLSPLALVFFLSTDLPVARRIVTRLNTKQLFDSVPPSITKQPPLAFSSKSIYTRLVLVEARLSPPGLISGVYSPGWSEQRSISPVTFRHSRQDTLISAISRVVSLVNNQVHRGSSSDKNHNYLYR